MNAQGAITWDEKGKKKYSQGQTYSGDPRQFSAMAPEMAGIADEYFSAHSRVGFRVGCMCAAQGTGV